MPWGRFGDPFVLGARCIEECAEERCGVAQVFWMPLHAHVKSRCVAFDRFDNGVARRYRLKKGSGIANRLVVHGVDEKQQRFIRLLGMLFAICSMKYRFGRNAHLVSPSLVGFGLLMKASLFVVGAFDKGKVLIEGSAKRDIHDL